MQFSLSAEQEALAGAVRQFLAAKAPESAVRQAMASELGYDPALWSRLAGELGLHGLAIPEKYGGAGFTFVELGIALQEMGRALLPGPFFPTVVLAANALIESNDEAAAAEWLPRIAAGELVATVPLPQELSVRATRGGSGWQLTGRAGFVLDGALAELVIVPAQTEQGPSLFAVPGSSTGLARRPLEFFDVGRRMAELTFADCPGQLIGSPGDAGAAIGRIFDLAAIGLAAECVGVSERALEMATEYAKIRHQFGKPIGAFQAIKHKLANVLLEVEAARSAAWYGLWCAAERPEEIPVVAPLILPTCTETAYLAAAENIQVHGGIGYTWEHPAQLYFRRATVSRQLLGDPAEHREQLLKRLDY